MEKILCTGAGGFISHNFIKYLKKKGHWVRGIDIKTPKFEHSWADEFYIGDLRLYTMAERAVENIDTVFNFAADMGGIFYISKNHALIMKNNILINVNMLEASRNSNVDKFLFSSSACVYPQHLQLVEKVTPLKESDAYPADSEPGYGWEKLFGELLNRYYFEDYGLKTYIVRFHNIFGPYGTFRGGKEKAPAALCRKIIEITDPGEIIIWGDGSQTRSFCYIDDCVEGIYRVVQSDYHSPLNIGSNRLISINDLAKIIIDISKKDVSIKNDLSKPQGVRGRTSDNTKIKEILNWEPKISLEYGLEKTYRWIETQINGKKSR